ncbi:MAG TPA: hypothetical protein VHB20_19170 [Verrucomicrobiae bacterium]|jgi:hypothetical protein|nr:hypothetical protein [Verrucomicrobiae bacterium]
MKLANGRRPNNNMNVRRVFLIIGAVVVLACGIPFLPGSTASDETRTVVLYGLGGLAAGTFWFLNFKMRPLWDGARPRRMEMPSGEQDASMN